MEQQKAHVKKLTDVVLQLQNDINTNVMVNRRASVQILEPIDPTRPSSFNGQTFQNAKVTLEEKQTDSTASVTDQSKTGIQVATSNEVKAKAKTKDVESKRPNPWLWIGITAVIFFGLFLFINKKR
jgi:hypothetical protein